MHNGDNYTATLFHEYEIRAIVITITTPTTIPSYLCYKGY